MTQPRLTIKGRDIFAMFLAAAVLLGGYYEVLGNEVVYTILFMLLSGYGFANARNRRRGGGQK